MYHTVAGVDPEFLKEDGTSTWKEDCTYTVHCGQSHSYKFCHGPVALSYGVVYYDLVPRCLPTGVVFKQHVLLICQVTAWSVAQKIEGVKK